VGCPEVCDIDCNNNGIPDVCDDQSDVCPPLDVVFVMDTSGSMRDEGDALCGQIATIIDNLDQAGVVLEPTILAIHPNKSQDLFTCLSMSDTVHAIFGDDVPGDPDGCPGNLNGHSSSEKDENWGPATAIVAQEFAWNPGAIRMIVPISDEGPCLGTTGNGCNDPGSDRGAIENAIEIANQNGVIVSPITASGSSACVKTLAADLASATGGVSVASTNPDADLAGAIEAIVRAACVSFCSSVP
jgi:hypothetical protein